MLRTSIKDKAPFWLGIWYVVPTTRQIISESSELVLEPDMMSVLNILAQRGGEVVKMDDLIATVWPSLDIDYNVLADTIIKLREKLGDDPKNPQYIETVSQQGYRMRARVYYKDPPIAGIPGHPAAAFQHSVSPAVDAGIQSGAQAQVSSAGNTSAADGSAPATQRKINEQATQRIPPVAEELLGRKKSAHDRLYTNLFGARQTTATSLDTERYAYYLLGLVLVIAVALYSVLSENGDVPLPSQVEKTRPAPARSFAGKIPFPELPAPVATSAAVSTAANDHAPRNTVPEPEPVLTALNTPMPVPDDGASVTQRTSHTPLINGMRTTDETDASRSISTPPMVRQQAKTPTLLVLPFANLSHDINQQYLCEGISQTLSESLARYAGLTLMPFRQPDPGLHQTSELDALARLTGARYVVQGDVRRELDEIRVRVKLIDVMTTNTLWQETYKNTTTAVFRIQSAMRQQILNHLGVSLSAEEMHNSKSTSGGHSTSGSFAAYDLYLQGRYQLQHSTTAQEHQQAGDLMEKAIALDPGFAPAYSVLATIHADNFRFGWNDADRSGERALQEAEQAVRLDPVSPQASWALGYVALYVSGDHKRAIEMSERTIDLDPKNPEGYTLLSDAHTFGGSPEKARLLLESLKQDQQEYHAQIPSTLGLANLLLGKYQDSLQSLNESLEMNRSRSLDMTKVQGNVYKVIALYRMGDVDDAHTQARQLVSMLPEFDVKAWARRQPFKDNNIRDGMINDLEHIIRL